MAVYVDKLRDWGWRLGPSCHLITDGADDELHKFAARIGLKRSWFQESTSGHHYDLTASKRTLAVRIGAIELDDIPFHAVLKQQRQRLIRRAKAKSEGTCNDDSD